MLHDNCSKSDVFTRVICDNANEEINKICDNMAENVLNFNQIQTD